MSLTATFCNSIVHLGSAVIKFDDILFGEFISRKERKGAKTAAPLLLSERCEKHDDKNSQPYKSATQEKPNSSNAGWPNAKNKTKKMFELGTHYLLLTNFIVFYKP